MVLRRLVRKLRLRTVLFGILAVLFLTSAGLGYYVYDRYRTAPVMEVPITEFTSAEYPENPGALSVHAHEYSGPTLKLVKLDERHFDFILVPRNEQTAKIIFHNIDVSLMTPNLPEWTKSDAGLRRIALTDRQWNRQQVRFNRESPHLEIIGGNGFEKEHLYTAELAKNCLNAGLWEVILTVKEDGRKAAYYHGWFTFPLGHYRDLFEVNTGLSYLDHWCNRSRAGTRKLGIDLDMKGRFLA